MPGRRFLNSFRFWKFPEFMRTIFFLGKGGVGKSTLAVLSALFCARQNRKTRLLSLDRAHNLFDILGNDPQTIPNLTVTEADIDHFIKTYLQQTENLLRQNYRYLTALNLEKHFKVLRFSPGMEEYGLLLAYQHFFNRASEEILLVDMPPTALALKFFNLPSVSLMWLEQLVRLRNEILEKKEIVTRVKLGKKEVETDKIKKNLQKQIDFYEQLQKHFQSSEQCKINVITNPDSISMAETERILNFLKEMGIVGVQTVVNKTPLVEAGKKLDGGVKKIQLPEAGKPLVRQVNLTDYLVENQHLIQALVEGG